MARTAKVAECHPERKHFAKGKCSACYAKDHRRSNPEYQAYMKEYSAKYRADNPDKCTHYYKTRTQDSTRRERDKEKRADLAYRAKYGMGTADVEAMIDAQGSACKICSEPITRSTANVDHCHTTGYVRGILCSSCNTGIGLLGDNAEGLKRALKYLEGSPTSFKAD